MIASQDRSGWFGASDTARIMGNWHTHTFMRWWLVKLGTVTDNYSSRAMRAGTAYEHKILDALGIVQRDRQIKIRPLRLRVNLDGETMDTVEEVKTYGTERFVVSRAYWQQMQVEMFAARAFGEIIAYRMEPEDYRNFYNPIDYDRISRHPIAYDPGWVEREYLPRLQYLAWCLKRRRTPSETAFQVYQGNRHNACARPSHPY